MHPIAFFDKKVVQKLEQTSSKVRAVVLLICFALGIALMGIMRTQMQAPHNAGDIPKTVPLIALFMIPLGFAVWNILISFLPRERAGGDRFSRGGLSAPRPVPKAKLSFAVFLLCVSLFIVTLIQLIAR